MIQVLSEFEWCTVVLKTARSDRTKTKTHASNATEGQKIPCRQSDPESGVLGAECRTPNYFGSPAGRF